MRFNKFLTILLFLFILPNIFSMTGSGTAIDPYIVTTLNDLNNVRDNLSAYYELGNDINAYDTKNWGEEGWLPIGGSTTNCNADDAYSEISGNFNGKEYKIINLFIDRPQTNCIGLFGYTEGATIQNVGVDVNINSGYYYVGALIGRTLNSAISNSYSLGDINSYSQIGGLIGSNTQTSITQSYSTININASRIGGYLGGLIGTNQSLGSDVNNSYATGTTETTGNNVCGGLIGEGGSISFVINSYSSGNLTVPIRGGGLVGFMTGISIKNSFSISDGGTGGIAWSLAYGSIKNTWWNNDASSCISVGSLDNNTCIKASSKTDFYNSSHPVYGNDINSPAWDFGMVWFEGKNYYPRLQWELTVNLIQPNNSYFSYPTTSDGNALIEFTAKDVNAEKKLFVDVYYSSSQGAFENLIWKDINLMYLALNPTDDMNCTTIDFTSPNKCVMDYNFMQLADGNYFIDLNIHNEDDLNKIDSEEFNVYSTPVPDTFDFTISMPATCSVNKGCLGAGCSTCTRCWAEPTDSIIPIDGNIACQGQDNTTPFLVIDFTGSASTFDLNMFLEETPPANLYLRVNSNNALATSTRLTNASQLIIADQTPTGTQDANIWVWGEFEAYYPDDLNVSGTTDLNTGEFN